MTEEAQKPAAEAGAPSATEEVTVVPDVPPAEKPVTEKEAKPASVPEPEPELAEKPAATDEVVEAEKPKTAEEEKTIAQSVSFKEESYVVGELPESQKKALDELKQLVQDALNKHEFTPPPPATKEEEPKAEEKKEEEPKAEEKKEEEPKAEEKKEEKTEEKTEGETVEEPPKAEPAAESEKEKAPEPAEAAPVTVVVAEVVEKVTAVDEDGAKTVEAIEESVVSVSVPAEEATSSTKDEVEAVAPPPPQPEEVYIWGIPLLGDERSDVILLKFLRARDYKVKDAFTMLKNTVKWRKEFGIDSLIEEDLGSDWEKVVFTHGVDKDGHPVCYNVFGEFQNKELYQKTFVDEEKRSKFIKWRIQFLEKSIRKFDFNPTGISTIVQVNDLKNSPFFLNKELVTGQAIQLLQDNYPEFLAKQVLKTKKTKKHPLTTWP